MAFLKLVIAFALMALMACATAQAPETGRDLKSIGFKGIGHKGLGIGHKSFGLGHLKHKSIGHIKYDDHHDDGYKLKHKSFGHIKYDHHDDHDDYKYKSFSNKKWFNNYSLFSHKGKSIRYVVYKDNKCYEEDWCSRNRRICFDEHYNECDCNYKGKYRSYYKC